ncbi:MAG: alpha/beta fold hydrolase [Phycisphaerales bacterium]|nr:alpha/beta fold hydrolase [Phycisphaerales bacterium]
MSFKLILPGLPAGSSPVWDLQVAGDGASAKGTMQQAGMMLVASITKLAAGAQPAGPNRPQTPTPPFPYTMREVAYESFDGAAMNGTLVLPPAASAEARHPCILLITGSGVQDRDETLFNHKPFAVIADALARAGIASLRVDDRGWKGAKDPAGKEATTETFVQDVRAGVAFLAQQPEIDPKRIGLLGHSEGGLIAPAVAAEMGKGSVAFIVLLAGPGVSGYDCLREQMGAILRANGSSPQNIELALARQNVTLTAVMAGDTAAARTSMREAIAENSAAAGVPAPQGAALDAAIDSAMKQVDSAWMRHFLTRDPRQALSRTTCPVLVLNGGKDAQVVASQNIPQIARALLDGGNTDVTIRVFPGLNHLFQPCTTGAVAEYGQIETTIDPAVLETITRWIAEIAK